MNRPTYDRPDERDWRHRLFWGAAGVLAVAALVKRLFG